MQQTLMNVGHDNSGKIDELVSRVLKIDLEAVTTDMSPENTEQWDSLNHLMLITALEEEFSIDIDPEEIIQMYKGYKDFKSVVSQKLSETIG